MQDSEKITLTWQNVEVGAGARRHSKQGLIERFKGWWKKTGYAEMQRPILKRISGIAEPGKLLAIIGARFWFIKFQNFVVHKVYLLQWGRKDYPLERACSSEPVRFGYRWIRASEWTRNWSWYSKHGCIRWANGFVYRNINRSRALAISSNVNWSFM